MNALRLSSRLAPRAFGLARSVAKPSPSFSEFLSWFFVGKVPTCIALSSHVLLAMLRRTDVGNGLMLHSKLVVSCNQRSGQFAWSAAAFCATALPMVGIIVV